MLWDSQKDTKVVKKYLEIFSINHAGIYSRNLRTKNQNISQLKLHELMKLHDDPNIARSPSVKDTEHLSTEFQTHFLSIEGYKR